MKARVLTPWTGTGADDDPNRPLIGDAFKVNWVDVTAQPSENLSPDPNLYILEVTCDADTLAAIKADSRFLVVWDDAIVSLRRGSKRDDKPSAANFGQFRSSLAKLGIKQADINAAVGSKVNGRTWQLICNDFIVWLKARPKAV